MDASKIPPLYIINQIILHLHHSHRARGGEEGGEEGIALGEVGCASPHNEARPSACMLLMWEARSRSYSRQYAYGSS